VKDLLFIRKANIGIYSTSHQYLALGGVIGLPAPAPP